MNRSLSILFFVSISSLIFSLQAYGEEAGIIILANVKGEIIYKTSADAPAQVASEGIRVGEGAVVETMEKSSAILVFSNGSTVNLSEKTKISVKQFLQEPFDTDPADIIDAKREPSMSQTRLALDYGDMVGNIKKLRRGQGSLFEIETPAGIAGIRGTIVSMTVVLGPSGNNLSFSAVFVDGNGQFTQVDGSVSAINDGIVLTISESGETALNEADAETVEGMRAAAAEGQDAFEAQVEAIVAEIAAAASGGDDDSGDDDDDDSGGGDDDDGNLPPGQSETPDITTGTGT